MLSRYVSLFLGSSLRKKIKEATKIQKKIFEVLNKIRSNPLTRYLYNVYCISYVQREVYPFLELGGKKRIDNLTSQKHRNDSFILITPPPIEFVQTFTLTFWRVYVFKLLFKLRLSRVDHTFQNPTSISIIAKTRRYRAVLGKIAKQSKFGLRFSLFSCFGCLQETGK